MSINFNTSNDTLRLILGNGLRYKIPQFQRDYSWTIEQWEDLWEDILQLIPSATQSDSNNNLEQEHYMGYLVLQSQDNDNFIVIDGQQRITTLSIIILATISHLSELPTKHADESEENLRRAENLRSTYIGYLDPVSLLTVSKLSLNRYNNDYFQSYIVPLERMPYRGRRSSELLLRSAFNYFKDKIAQFSNDGAELAGLVQSIASKLFFTKITVSNELNAFTVFETLNARGVQLSSTDLLKNYLFSLITNEKHHEDRIQQMETIWEHMLEDLGSEKIPEFVRAYWNGRNALARQSELFKAMRKQIKTAENTFTLLRNLRTNAEVYSALQLTSTFTWNHTEETYLRLLKMLNIRQAIPLLMLCFEVFGEKNRAIFTEILHAIFVVSFRYNVIAGLNPHEQEKIYSHTSQKIVRAELVNKKSIINSLKALYVDDTRFTIAFATREFDINNGRNRKLAKYILGKLEEHETGAPYDIEDGKNTIEHIYSQSPEEDDWSQITIQHVHRLGNMTLLESAKNREIENKAYTDKMPVYAQSSFKITRDIPENYATWNESTISSRQQQLARLAKTIWRVEF